jgi:pimeloyl-ACP methyl ester carboxylesterase
MNMQMLKGALLIVALGFSVQVQAQEAAPASSTPTSTTTTSTTSVATEPALPQLVNAFSADRLSFDLAGFGKVAYYADLKGEGRPLLLLTSVNAAANAYEMRPIFLAYQGKRPVYVLEWPGFGFSDRPEIRYTPELMTAALSRLVAIIGQDLDLVALSLGSEFAARAAAAEPRIKSLALISPTGVGDPKPADFAQRSERLYINLSNPLYAENLYKIIATKVSIRFFLNRSFVGKPDAGLVDYAYLATRLPGARYAPLHFISGVLTNPDAYTELYSKVNQPTLVLYDRDGFINFSRLPALLQARPNVTAVRVAPSLGLPQFEQPAQVTAALDAFWAGLK